MVMNNGYSDGPPHSFCNQEKWKKMEQFIMVEGSAGGSDSGTGGWCLRLQVMHTLYVCGVVALT